MRRCEITISPETTRTVMDAYNRAAGGARNEASLKVLSVEANTDPITALAAVIRAKTDERRKQQDKEKNNVVG
jgi:hypothetical protein